MSANIHIKIGDLKGESQDAGHKDEIDVLSWSWGAISGLEQTATALRNPRGPASVKHLRFTKRVDRCSPELLSACIEHRSQQEVVLTVRKAGVEPALEYLKLTLGEAVVASVDIVQREDSLFVFEEVVLHFLSARFEYREQTSKGTSAATREMGWSSPLNK